VGVCPLTIFYTHKGNYAIVWTKLIANSTKQLSYKFSLVEYFGKYQPDLDLADLIIPTWTKDSLKQTD
jgi:hypothetical protein